MPRGARKREHGLGLFRVTGPAHGAPLSGGTASYGFAATVKASVTQKDSQSAGGVPAVTGGHVDGLHQPGAGARNAERRDAAGVRAGVYAALCGDGADHRVGHGLAFDQQLHVQRGTRPKRSPVAERNELGLQPARTQERGCRRARADEDLRVAGVALAGRSRSLSEARTLGDDTFETFFAEVVGELRSGHLDLPGADRHQAEIDARRGKAQFGRCGPVRV